MKGQRMESYDYISKGPILFKERRMNNLAIFLLMLLGYLVCFVLSVLWLIRTSDDFAYSAFWGAALTLMMVAITIPFLLMRRFPLVIYEKGFDAPIPLSKFLQRNKRFVEFSSIESIHPEYVSTFGTSRLGGYSVITSDGSKIDIRDIDEGRLRTIRDTLKSVLKDKWRSLYADAPYLGFEELQRMREQLSRPKRSVWIEGLGIIFLLYGFLFASIFIFPLLLVMILVVISLFGILFEVSRMSFYYIALENYKKAVEWDPSLKGLLSSSLRAEIDERSPLERAERFTEEDWKRLERSIHNMRPWYFMLAGLLVMVTATILGRTVPYSLFSAILFSGLAVLLSSLLFLPRMTKDIELVKSLIELELKQGRRILPGWFRVRPGILKLLPFREAPRYSDEQWVKLVRGSKMKDERRFAAILVLFVSLILVSIALPRAFGLPKYIGMAVFAISMITLVSYIFVNAGRASMLQSILTFEEQSGQKVIPEKYRSQMFKGWRAGGKKGRTT